MTFGGSSDGCAYVRLLSVGKLGEDVNEVLSQQISTLVAKEFKIEKERVFIEYYDSSPSFAWNG